MMIKTNPRLQQLTRFLLVGASGVLVNLVIFTPTNHVLANVIGNSGANNAASLLAFLLAAGWNYLLNHVWTFATRTTGTKPAWRAYGKYLTGAAVGQLITMGVLNVVVTYWQGSFWGWSNAFWGQLAGIGCGTVFNYMFAGKVVFKKNRS